MNIKKKKLKPLCDSDSSLKVTLSSADSVCWVVMSIAVSPQPQNQSLKTEFFALPLYWEDTTFESGTARALRWKLPADCADRTHRSHPSENGRAGNFFKTIQNLLNWKSVLLLGVKVVRSRNESEWLVVQKNQNRYYVLKFTDHPPH